MRIGNEMRNQVLASCAFGPGSTVRRSLRLSTMVCPMTVSAKEAVTAITAVSALVGKLSSQAADISSSMTRCRAI